MHRKMLKQRHRSIRMDFVSEMKRPRMRPLSLVSEGTTLTVDTDAEAEDGWVAVNIKDRPHMSVQIMFDRTCIGEAVTIEEEKAALAKKAEEEAAAKATGDYRDIHRTECFSFSIL